MIHRIIVVLINVVSIWLGFWVYSRHNYEKTGRAFALMVLMMLIWVDFSYGARLMEGNQVLAEISLKIAWFATPIFLACFYFLIIFLLQRDNHYWLNKSVILAAGIIGALTGFTDSVVAGIKFVNDSLTIVYGAMMYFYLGGIIFLILANIYVLFSGYKKLPLAKKRQIEYFLIGVSIFIFCNAVFNIILPIYKGITRFYYWGDYATIFLLIFTAYAMIRRNLFETKTVLTTLLIALISVLLTVEFFIVRQKEELMRLAHGLERANRELKRLDHAKSEFISIASHQLRTPLTAMRGYLSMLVQGDFGELSGQTKEIVAEVHQASLRLLKLSNDLLNVSRIESGKSVLNYKKTSIKDLVSLIAKEFEAEAAKKDLYLKVVVADDLPSIEIDAEKIRQAVLNITDNALKYTQKGGVKILAKYSPPENILIEIRDTGVGLNKKEIGKLFQSFSRGQAGANLYSAGTGLGLYVARKFVDQHKGRLWVESPGPDKGSSFYIELPIKPK